MHRALAVFAVFSFSVSALAFAVDPDPKSPETVVVTYHVRPGGEAAMEKLLREDHWPLLRRLGFVWESPHVLVRGVEEGGKPVFREILTWRDHDTPDDAPPEVHAVWDRMKPLVEKRGADAIEIDEVDLLVPAPAAVAPRPSPAR
jgi:hypothetical protein